MFTLVLNLAPFIDEITLPFPKVSKTLALNSVARRERGIYHCWLEGFLVSLQISFPQIEA